MPRAAELYAKYWKEIPLDLGFEGQTGAWKTQEETRNPDKGNNMHIDMEIGKKMVGLQAYKDHCDTGLRTHGGGWGTRGLTRKKPAGAHLANLNGLDLSCRQLGREASWPTLFLGESLLSKQEWLSTIYLWSPEPCSFLFLCQWVGSGREDHPLGVTTHTSDFHGDFSKPYGMRKAYSEIWKENSPMLSLTLVFPPPTWFTFFYYYSHRITSLQLL